LGFKVGFLRGFGNFADIGIGDSKGEGVGLGFVEGGGFVHEFEECFTGGEGGRGFGEVLIGRAVSRQAFADEGDDAF